MLSDFARQLSSVVERDGHPSSDFDLNPDVVKTPSRQLRDAAVLVAFRSGADEIELLLTRRSSALKHHPGQIAFPGGKKDEADVDVSACALREAREEVGLPSQSVAVAGLLPSHETVTSFSVTPVLATITAPFIEKPEAGEVDEVFWVPLSHVLIEANYSIQSRLWQGKERHYYTLAYGPYYIWGATARILRGLCDRLSA